MAQRPMVLVGILLAVLGVGALLYQRFSYTDRETVLDVGSVSVTAETKKTVPLPPILGGVVLAGGVGLILIGMNKRQSN
jgi:hypothetical protein